MTPVSRISPRDFSFSTDATRRSCSKAKDAGIRGHGANQALEVQVEGEKADKQTWWKVDTESCGWKKGIHEFQRTLAEALDNKKLVTVCLSFKDGCLEVTGYRIQQPESLR